MSKSANASNTPLPSRYMDLLAQHKERYTRLRMSLKNTMERARNALVLDGKEHHWRMQRCVMDLPQDTVTELYKLSFLRGVRPKNLMESIAIRVINLWTRNSSDPTLYIRRMEDPKDADESLCADPTMPSPVAAIIDDPEAGLGIFLDAYDSLRRMGINADVLVDELSKYERAFGLARKVSQQEEAIVEARANKSERMKIRRELVNQGLHTVKTNYMHRKVGSVDDIERLPGEGPKETHNSIRGGSDLGGKPVENPAGSLPRKDASAALSQAVERVAKPRNGSGAVPSEPLRKGTGGKGKA